MNLVIIDYGAGNIKSLQFAFQRLGVQAQLTSDFDEIKKADRVIFPGVGEASSAMLKLRHSKLDMLIPELTQPVLGICLGMQLMCKYSEEGNTDGLGIFGANVKRFNHNLKIPQMGWNNITHLKSGLFEGIKEKEYMYLVHSFYAEANDQTIAKINYGFDYAGALKKDNFYGVQFHPEKSSKAGQEILKNFLKFKT